MNKHQVAELRIIFAVFLETARKKHGLTHADVAKRMGATEEIVAQWETGKRDIDIAELRRYCQAVELTLDECIVFLECIFDENKHKEAGTAGD
jgi:transcriptional regulator with XRE-family HTH domain